MAAQKINTTTQYSRDLFQFEKPFSLFEYSLSWTRDLLLWWYVSMPVWYVMSLRRVLLIIDDKFSISFLLKNFFIPWHRDYTFVGLFMGIIMKAILIPIGLLVWIIVLCLYLIFLLFWIILPLATVVAIISTPVITIFV